jgi:hypothetical protein
MFLVVDIHSKAYCSAVVCIMALYDCVSFLEVCRYPECGSSNFLLGTGNTPMKLNRTAIQITLTTISMAVKI